jgi:hypothetical protein
VKKKLTALVLAAAAVLGAAGVSSAATSGDVVAAPCCKAQH